MTIYVTVFYDVKPQQPQQPCPCPWTPEVKHEHMRIIAGLWHRAVPVIYGDISPSEAHELWHRFVAEPVSDADMAVRMMKRRTNQLFVDYTSLN